MFCPNCGNQLPEGSQFCASCGTSMTAPQSQNPAVQDPPVTPAAPEVPKKAKKRSKLPIVIISLVLAAALVTTVWLLFFSKKTVYLMESYVQISYSGSTTSRTAYEYEYDDVGNLLRYAYEFSNEGSSDYSYGWEIGYEYTKDGLLERAERDYDGDETEFEYIYSDDGVLEEVEGKADDGSRIKASCDKEGRIESIKTYNSVGEVIIETTFEYDDEGKLEEKRIENGGIIQLYTYENNKVVEQVTKYDGEVQYRSIYDYDEKGAILEQTVYGPDNELQISMKFEYTYEKDKLMEMVIMAEDSEGNENEVVGEVEWDGDEEAVMELTVESGEIDDFPKDAKIELTYDKHGNLLTVEISAGGETLMEQNYSYVAVKVPRDYEEFWNGDPIWMIG